MTSPKRVMVFIDFDNINIPARRLGIKFLDFNGLRNMLCKGHRVVGCTVYLPYKMASIASHIQKSGLDIQLVSPGKSIDGRLIFDLLRNTYDDSFDLAIIASGDRDFVPVLQEVKKKKKEIKIASFNSNLAHALKSIADDVIELDSQLASISVNLNKYQCVKCCKVFEVPYKIFSTNPLCEECRYPS